jgi:hypothetical protein
MLPQDLEGVLPQAHTACRRTATQSLMKLIRHIAYLQVNRHGIHTSTSPGVMQPA